MESSLQFLPTIQGIIGGVLSSICFVVLWLKSGHSPGIAWVGVVPAIAVMFPTFLIWAGYFSLNSIYISGFIGWLIFIVHLLVLTFKSWPALVNKPEATFE